MTSAAIKQGRDASGHHGEGYWTVIFAAVLLGVVGIFDSFRLRHPACKLRLDVSVTGRCQP